VNLSCNGRRASFFLRRVCKNNDIIFWGKRVTVTRGKDWSTRRDPGDDAVETGTAARCHIRESILFSLHQMKVGGITPVFSSEWRFVLNFNVLHRTQCVCSRMFWESEEVLSEWIDSSTAPFRKLEKSWNYNKRANNCVRELISPWIFLVDAGMYPLRLKKY